MVNEFKVADESDWAAVREMRLRSLKSDPTAFNISHQDALQFPDSYWHGQVSLPNSWNHAWVLGYTDGELSCVTAARVDRGHWMLYSLWVDPAFRGQGVSDALMAFIEDVGRSRGHRVGSLWVRKVNTGAEAFYRRHGYSEGYYESPIAPEDRPAIYMVKDLS